MRRIYAIAFWQRRGGFAKSLERFGLDKCKNYIRYYGYCQSE